MDINLGSINKTKIREKKLRQIENKKLEIYGLNKTKGENDILEEALNEMVINKKTDIVCPRCKNKLILLKNGASSELKCLNNEICIKIINRGI
jgi:ssDNA-binding Zn-finger/Zn-ribbon topoisomerase 1